MSDYSHQEEHPADSHHLLDVEDARMFILAGRCIFTVVSLRTAARFTFKVTLKEFRGNSVYRVGVLTGPNNSSDYTSLGTIEEGRWLHWERSRISPQAPCAVAFRYLWWCVNEAKCIPAQMEIWTAGLCGKCLAPLTVPSSRRLGFGPICAGNLGMGDRIEWSAVFPNGKAFLTHGPTEAEARRALRQQLGTRRLPKGVQLTCI